MIMIITQCVVLFILFVFSILFFLFTVFLHAALLNVTKKTKYTV